VAKAKNPSTFSREYSLAHSAIESIGVLDSTLAIDTRLFIDPLLLAHSKHEEMREAAQTFRKFFEKVIKLLSASKRMNDPAWKAAKKLMAFPEISGTCLGYGAGSIRGSGFGDKLTQRIVTLASQIIEIGIDDPELFPLMALIEPDIGPDRVSDMTTNIIFDSLAAFNVRAIMGLGLTPKTYRIRGSQYKLLQNPCESSDRPLILVPTDVLRDLPVAQDWDGIAQAAHETEQIRNDVNTHIGEIWEKKSKRNKAKLKTQALSSREAFQLLLNAMQASAHVPYPVEKDPEGLTQWAAIGYEAAQKQPLSINKPTARNGSELKRVVAEIVAQFRHLVENCGINKDLYREDKSPRHESTAQRIFFSVAYAYCKSNDIDISPEIDTGNGKIDFKFSQGFNRRVLVEIKLSTNSGTVSGYNNQLELYKRSQETESATYLVIDVGSMGKKDERLLAERNKAVKRGDPVSDVEFVDATLKPSASKRKN
jgi:hypothetical protein